MSRVFHPCRPEFHPNVPAFIDKRARMAPMRSSAGYRIELPSPASHSSPADRASEVASSAAASAHTQDAATKTQDRCSDTAMPHSKWLFLLRSPALCRYSRAVRMPSAVGAQRPVVRRGALNRGDHPRPVTV